jgi:two-component system invasion response regulator UvrY
VIVADDHWLTRASLADRLDGEPDIRVVGRAVDGAEALALVRRLHPDVALLDVRMPGMDGLEVTRAIRSEGHTAVVVMSSYASEDYEAAAAAAGASAYLSKGCLEDDLVAAVRSAGGNARNGARRDPAEGLA